MNIRKPVSQAFASITSEMDVRGELPDFDIYTVVEAWVSSAIAEVKHDQILSADFSTRHLSNPLMRKNLIKMLSLVQTLATHECEKCAQLEHEIQQQSWVKLDVKAYEDLQEAYKGKQLENRKLMLEIRELKKELGR